MTYTYEPAGNRIKTGGTFARTNLPPALASASYNANNQQATFGTSTETYDLNGNLATVTDASGTTTYTWNAKNQLTAISGPGLTASFTYDSFGRRTGKTINGTTTNFVYDGLNPVQEKNEATVTANLLTGLGIDEFFTRTDGVGIRALLADALGSTIALGDNTGTLQTQYTFEPFGLTTQAGSVSTNSYKYTGREDDGTGLAYYRARYYFPRMQRFIAEDPIGFGGGDIDLYAYAHNNPLLLRDPLGLLTLGRGTLLGCGLGGVGGGFGARKNAVAGAATGGGLGCAFGTLIASGIPLPPMPLGIGIGALTGGISAGLTAAAGGATPLGIGVAALGGAAGGAISNLLPFGPGVNAIIGAGVGAFVGVIGPE